MEAERKRQEQEDVAKKMALAWEKKQKADAARIAKAKAWAEQKAANEKARKEKAEKAK